MKYGYVVHLRDTGTVQFFLGDIKERMLILFECSMALSCLKSGSDQREKKRIEWWIICQDLSRGKRIVCPLSFPLVPMLLKYHNRGFLIFSYHSPEKKKISMIICIC